MNLERMQQSGMTLDQVMQLMREAINGSNGPSGPSGPGYNSLPNSLVNLGVGGGLAAALAGGLPGASTSAVASNLGGAGATGAGTAAGIGVAPALAGLAVLGVTGKGIYDVATNKKPSTFSDVGLGVNPVTASLYWPARKMGFFRTGKSKEQQKRDTWRQTLQDAGLIDKSYEMTLPSGAKLDWGKDGGAKLPNTGKIEGNPNKGGEIW